MIFNISNEAPFGEFGSIKKNKWKEGGILNMKSSFYSSHCQDFKKYSEEGRLTFENFQAPFSLLPYFFAIFQDN